MNEKSSHKMDGGLNTTVPQLYETEEIPSEQKIVHEVFVLESVRFYWLIVEYDPKQKLAFGYANLNDDLFAEWGYISIPEIEGIHAHKLDNWKPQAFPEALKLVPKLLKGC